MEDTTNNNATETTEPVTEVNDTKSAEEVEFKAKTSVTFGLAKDEIVPNLMFAGVDTQIVGELGLFNYIIQGMEVHFDTVITEDLLLQAIEAVFTNEGMDSPLPKVVAVVEKRIEAANVRSIKRARDFARHTAGLSGLNVIEVVQYWHEYASLHGQSFNTIAENIKFMKSQYTELMPLAIHAKSVSEEPAKAFKIFCDLIYEKIKEDFVTDQDVAVLEFEFIGI